MGRRRRHRFLNRNKQFLCSVGKHVAEAREWASNLYLRAAAKLVSLCRPKRLSVSTSTRFTDIALLPDSALKSLGEIIRQLFCQVGNTNPVTFAVAGPVGQENGGCRPIAILHITNRRTMRLISANISQWDVNFAGKWDSVLKGKSALRAHVARTLGVQLAHNEGQYVIHFLRDMRKFYDCIKAHLLIPQLVARGYPLEVGTGFSDVIIGCVSRILAGCLQSCS